MLLVTSKVVLSYESAFAVTEQEIIDLVISDPFQKAASGESQKFSTERRVSFINFVKKLLVPGGHVFLILPQPQISEWLEAFESFGMKTEGTFLLLKDPEHLQRVKGRNFQNLIEVAAVARKPERHPTKFTMDVISPYTQLPRNTYKRKAAIIDNISPPSNRLRFPGSKSLVRTAEKPPALIWESMKTFCPAGGTVLDPFAATLTVGIAGVQTGRSCVLLEVDQTCLKLAEARLRAFATKRLEEDEDYEQLRASDSFESTTGCKNNTADTEEQNETSSSRMQGTPGHVDTTLDSPDSEPEQAPVEDPKPVVVGDEQRGANDSEGDVNNEEQPEEFQCPVDDLRDTSAVKGSSEFILHSERLEAVPSGDQKTLDSSENAAINAEQIEDEPGAANALHSTSKNASLGDSLTESNETINHAVDL